MNNYITSIEVSEKYKVCHRDIVAKIKSLCLNYPEIEKEFNEVFYRTVKNKPFVGYELTKIGEFYLLTNININGKGAKELFEKKQEFIKEFLSMETMLTSANGVF